jgi:hypothetical protein
MFRGLFVQTFSFSRVHRKKYGGVDTGDFVGLRSFEMIQSSTRTRQIGTLHSVLQERRGEHLFALCVTGCSFMCI